MEAGTQAAESEWSQDLNLGTLTRAVVSQMSPFEFELFHSSSLGFRSLSEPQRPYLGLSGGSLPDARVANMPFFHSWPSPVLKGKFKSQLSDPPSNSPGRSPVKPGHTTHSPSLGRYSPAHRSHFCRMAQVAQLATP